MVIDFDSLRSKQNGLICLAPMIRATTAALRKLALEHGADVVWGEEILAQKIASCERRDNARIGTIDFVTRNGAVVFQVCPSERGRVVFQIGASDAVEALRGAEVFEFSTYIFDS